MKRILFTFLSLAIFSSGCTLYQINSKDTTKDYYIAKTSIDDVAYVEKTDKPYVEIAEISVTTERRRPLMKFCRN